MHPRKIHLLRCLPLAALAAACGSPASPASRTPTGYLMTFTPAPSCGAAFSGPARVVAKYRGVHSEWHVFMGLRPIGGPRDPVLEVRLRNVDAGSVEGSIYAGFPAFGGSSAMYFRLPDSPSFPVRVPFAATGEALHGDVTATLNAHAWNAAGGCAAADHRLRFERVYDPLD